MKNQEEQRIWVTTIFAQAMMEKLGPGNGIEIVRKDLSLEVLKDVKFISVLKYKPLVKFLNSKGIGAKLNDVKFQILPGDRVMVINPNIKLHKMEEDEELPEHTTITITEYLVK